MHNQVEKICRYKACLGCGLCVDEKSKQKMELYTDGYYHPSDKALIDPDFKKFCPGFGIYQKHKKKTKQEILYGPIVSPVVCGHATNKTINYQASSGGIITALCIHLLKNGLVDGILQVRQSHKDPTRTEPHLSSTIEDVLECMGSRYAPCSLFEHLREYLSTGKRLAVVGKPCDIAALKQYMAVYPEKTCNILYTFSMMCMGLPSHKATLEMTEYLGVDPQTIRNIRYRGFGWPGKAVVESQDGTKKECTYIQSWGAILGRDTLFRCKLCPNGFGEFADISCGDAWYCKNGNPSFNNDEAGRSFIFIRSDKGKELVEQAIADGAIVVEPYDMKEMPFIQKSQYQRKVNIPIRYVLYKILVNPQFRLKGFRLIHLCKIAGVRSLIKDGRGFIGRWWRGYKGHKKC